MFIHLLGPSGSGTSTLGKALGEKLSIPWFDTDDIYWEKTDPPFRIKRDIGERQRMLEELRNSNRNWILSGSMLRWGDFLKDKIDILIYLYISPEKRIKRLKRREKERYGDRIEPGGDLYRTHLEFIRWALQYEEGGPDMRSRMSEEKWMAECTCRKIIITKEKSVEELVRIVEAEIGTMQPGKEEQ